MHLFTSRRRRSAVVASLATGLAVAVVASSGAANAAGAAAGPTVAVPSGNASWKGQATPAGAVPSDAVVDLEVVLNLADDAGAQALAADVSDPASPHYGAYISPSTFASRYAASDATVAAVRSWLTGAGLTVVAVPNNHRWVQVRGTVAAVQTAFGTGLSAYTVGARSMHAPTGAVTVPASLAKAVAGVTGLTSVLKGNRPSSAPSDDGKDLPGGPASTELKASAPLSATPGPLTTAPSAASPARLGVAPPPDAFVNGTPCSAYYGEKYATSLPTAYGKVAPYAPCGYVPGQVRSAYGLSAKNLNGAGTTVAIVDAYAAPTIESDANTYAVKHGGKPFAPGQFRQYTPDSYSYGYEDTVNGDQCGENGWYGEETLDVEAVHGVAPSANVVFVAGASCFDDALLGALNLIVDNRLAQIVSNSWGDAGDLDPVANAAELEAYKQTFVQAAAEGIGMFFSSGDSGDEIDNIGVRSTDFPASSPWVTAVGGTTLGIGKSGNRVLETGWGTTKSTLTAGAWAPAPPGNYLYGAGGGTSQTFAQPWYQRDAVPSSISRYFGGKPGRAVPDVAALGDPTTGFLVGETQTFPDGSVKYSEYRIGGTSLSSPVFAAVESIADQVQGRRHGFANPALYDLNRSALHDITGLPAPLGIVRSEFTNGVDAADGYTVSLRSVNQTGTLRTRPGYDDVTGLGTPNGTAFVYGLGD